MELDSNRAFLLLGSNLGNREENLAQAILLLSDTEIIKSKSSIYETAAWGKTDQPSFYNIAVEIKTTLSPEKLLKKVLAIEQEIGRIREEKWGPRIIDIDIIFYEQLQINIAGRLIIPHPEMQHRKFVLVPLAEIAPHFIHPGMNKSVEALLSELKDPLEVVKVAL